MSEVGNQQKIDEIVDRCGYEIKHVENILQSDIDYYSKRCAEEGFELAVNEILAWLRLEENNELILADMIGRRFLK